MNKYIRRGLQATLLVGAGGVIFAAQASAATTDGSQSVLGGNQVNAPVTAPVTVSGNAVAVLGSNATATSTPASAQSTRPSAAIASTQTTSGRQSVAGGNQVNAPVYAPVTVSGNAVAVGGSNAKARSNMAPATEPTASSGTSSQTTDGRQSIGGGNQVNAPVFAPVTVSGNAVALLGSTAKVEALSAATEGPGGSTRSSQPTDGRQSIGGGNQVNAPVFAPVTVSDNAVALLGSTAKVEALSAATEGPGGSTRSSQPTDGRQSVLGGNQVNAPVTAPLTISGNAIAAAGSAAKVETRSGASTRGTSAGSTQATRGTTGSSRSSETTVPNGITGSSGTSGVVTSQGMATSTEPLGLWSPVMTAFGTGSVSAALPSLLLAVSAGGRLAAVAAPVLAQTGANLRLVFWAGALMLLGSVLLRWAGSAQLQTA